MLKPRSRYTGGMNRDLLYSLGLALAAWPPLVGQSYQAQENPRPALQASAAKERAECAAPEVNAALGAGQAAPACRKEPTSPKPR